MLRSGISEYVVNTPGNVKVRETTAEENLKRRNYRVADNIDELDGDINSSIYYPASANGGVELQILMLEVLMKIGLCIKAAKRKG